MCSGNRPAVAWVPPPNLWIRFGVSLCSVSLAVGMSTSEFLCMLTSRVTCLCVRWEQQKLRLYASTWLILFAYYTVRHTLDALGASMFLGSAMSHLGNQLHSWSIEPCIAFRVHPYLDAICNSLQRFTDMYEYYLRLVHAINIIGKSGRDIWTRHCHIILLCKIRYIICTHQLKEILE